MWIIHKIFILSHLIKKIDRDNRFSSLKFTLNQTTKLIFQPAKHQIHHTSPINVKRSSSVCHCSETSTTKRKGFVLFLPFRRRTCQPFGKKIKISNNRNANQIIIDSSWVTFQYQSCEEFQSFFLVFFFFILQALRRPRRYVILVETIFTIIEIDGFRSYCDYTMGLLRKI